MVYTKETFADVLKNFELYKDDETRFYKAVSSACAYNGNTFTDCKEFLNWDSLSDTAKKAVVNGYTSGAKQFYKAVIEELDYAMCGCDDFVNDISEKNVADLEKYTSKNADLEGFLTNYSESVDC